MDDPHRPTVDELAARLCGSMWDASWIGTRTIDRDQVIAAYAADVPAFVANKALDQLIDDGIVRDDHEGLHGWPPGRVSVVHNPTAVEEYIRYREPDHLPWEFRQ